MVEPTPGAGVARGEGGAPGGRAGRGPARWPLVGGIAWVGVAGAAATVGVRWAWRDGLGPAEGAWLAAHYAALMCCTFALHAGMAMLPVVLFALWARRRRLLAAATALALLGAGPALLTLVPRGGGDGAGAAGGPVLTVMSANLLYSSVDESRLVEQIDRERPDVLVVQEWTRDGSARLGAAIRERLPHAVEAATDDAFGQAVFARQPLEGAARTYPPVGGFGTAQITVPVRLGDHAVRITNVHLRSPGRVGAYGEARREAAALARWVRGGEGAGAPDLLIGDFNATPEGPTVRALRGAGLRDAHAEAGWGRGATWPRTTWLRLLPGIRLDQALAGPRLESVESRILEDNGSDHAPIVVKVRWRDDGGGPARSAAAP